MKESENRCYSTKNKDENRSNMKESERSKETKMIDSTRTRLPKSTEPKNNTTEHLKQTG